MCCNQFFTQYKKIWHQHWFGFNMQVAHFESSYHFIFIYFIMEKEPKDLFYLRAVWKFLWVNISSWISVIQSHMLTMFMFKILDAMNRDSGIALQSIQVDGGMTANSLLMQLQADLVGIPVGGWCSYYSLICFALQILCSSHMRQNLNEKLYTF